MRKTLPAFFLLLATSAAAVPFTPYRTIENAWFRVAYPQGYRGEAEMILAYAVDIRERHISWLGEFADERVTIFLSDETNAFATSYSSSAGRLYAYLNINAIWAAYPDEVGNYIYNLLAHELTHIAHLSKTGTAGRITRLLFGIRWPVAATIPMWFKEGITTNTETLREEFFQEARGTSPRTRAVVLAMALEDRLPDFDDLSGYLNYEWPNVLSTYLLGGNFFDFLVEEYGLDSIRRLIIDHGRKIVPLFRRSFADAVGVDLPEVWEAWRVRRKREARELQGKIARTGKAADRLTFDGSYKNGIRFVDGRLYTTVRDVTANRIGLYSVDPRTGAMRQESEDLGSSYIVGGDEEHLYLLSDRGGRTIHYRYYDAYKYHVASGRMIRLTDGMKVSAFDVIDRDRLLCSSLYVGRPSLFLVSGGERRDIPLDESIMSVNHIAVRPDGGSALLSVTYRDGGTDLSLLDLISLRMRRITVDRNAKLFPHWIDGEQITFATPTDTGMFNQVVLDVPADGRIGTGDHRQITDLFGGVYWAHHTGSDLYYIGINADGYDVYHLGLEGGTTGGRVISMPDSFVMSPAASVEVETGLAERRFRDAVNMLDFVRLPFAAVDPGDPRDMDVGIMISSSGIRSTVLDYVGAYKTLYPYFENNVGLSTDALFVPIAAGFSNRLEVRDALHIRERYLWSLDVSYPLIIERRSTITFGLASALVYSRVYRDSQWDPAGLGWILAPSEYVILDLGSRYSPTDTSSLWRNRGFTAACVFTQPIDDFTGFTPFQRWNNVDLHLAVPLFHHDFGVKGRLFCALGGGDGPVYSTVSDAGAFLVDETVSDNAVPFRGSLPVLSAQSLLLASVELRATLFSSTYFGNGLLPVGLNKLGLLLYSDFLLPFEGLAPSGAPAVSFGVYATAELGLAYQALFMDLNFIVHYTAGDPRPAFAFAMDFPK